MLLLCLMQCSCCINSFASVLFVATHVSQHVHGSMIKLCAGSTGTVLTVVCLG